eukprot:2966390-Pleurochrysis_carterae.AAC.1
MVDELVSPPFAQALMLAAHPLAQDGYRRDEQLRVASLRTHTTEFARARPPAPWEHSGAARAENARCSARTIHTGLPHPRATLPTSNLPPIPLLGATRRDASRGLAASAACTCARALEPTRQVMALTTSFATSSSSQPSSSRRKSSLPCTAQRSTLNALAALSSPSQRARATPRAAHARRATR